MGAGCSAREQRGGASRRGRRSPQLLWKTLWENRGSQDQKHGNTAIWPTLNRNLCNQKNSFGINDLKKTSERRMAFFPNCPGWDGRLATTRIERCLPSLDSRFN